MGKTRWQVGRQCPKARWKQWGDLAHWPTSGKAPSLRLQEVEGSGAGPFVQIHILLSKLSWTRPRSEALLTSTKGWNLGSFTKMLGGRKVYLKINLHMQDCFFFSKLLLIRFRGFILIISSHLCPVYLSAEPEFHIWEINILTFPLQSPLNLKGEKETEPPWTRAPSPLPLLCEAIKSSLLNLNLPSLRWMQRPCKTESN